MAWIISRQTVRTGAENALGAVAQVQRVSHSQGAAATGGRDQQLCIKFNKYGGDCKFGKECKFLHACSSCKGPHPVSKCRAGGKAALGRMDEA